MRWYFSAVLWSPILSLIHISTENHALVQELLPKWKGLKRIDEVCRTCAFTELSNRVLAEKNRETAAPIEREN